MTYDAGGRQTRRSHTLPCPPGDHGCGQHLLLAGGPQDLPVLRHLVTTAPACSYGQVFVEVDGTHLDPVLVAQGFETPGGIGVTVLRRELGGTSLPRHGELLARAVSAWAAEWLAEDQCECSGPYALWVGYTTSPDVEQVCHDLHGRFPGTHAHLHRPGC